VPYRDLPLPPLLVALAAAAGGGCGPTAEEIRYQNVVSLEQRATEDLGCAAVDVADLGAQRWIARGCGREAVYYGGCDGQYCSWQMQSMAGGESPPATSSYRRTPEGAGPVVVDARPAGPSPLLDGGYDDDLGYADPCQEADAPWVEGTFEGSDRVIVEPGDPCQMEVPPIPQAQQAPIAPPAQPLDAVPPPQPSPSYVFVDGYWYWTGVRYVWAPGYWVPPRPGHVYVGGSWRFGGGAWFYDPGGWAPVGRRVVVGPPPPRPRTYVWVRPVPRVRAVRSRRVYVAPGRRVDVRPRRPVAPARPGVRPATPRRRSAPPPVRVQRQRTRSPGPAVRTAPARATPRPATAPRAAPARPSSPRPTAAPDRRRRTPQRSSSPSTRSRSSPSPPARVQPRPSGGSRSSGAPARRQ
jgi:hypothetical protein